jgi:hypothetical protein
MDSKPRRPQHASYRLHRSQVAWQVILPVVLAGLILIGAVYLVVVGTFQSNGDVGRWAAISTMWLSIPVMIGALIILVLLIGLGWVVGRAVGFIPLYTFKAQVFVSQVEAQVKQGALYVYRPTRIISAIGQLIRRAFRRLRG